MEVRERMEEWRLGGVGGAMRMVGGGGCWGEALVRVRGVEERWRSGGGGVVLRAGGVEVRLLAGGVEVRLLAGELRRWARPCRWERMMVRRGVGGSRGVQWCSDDAARCLKERCAEG